MARRISLADRPDATPLRSSVHTSAAERALAALRTHNLLLALIAGYLVIGFGASLLIPPWQSPDEPPHFAYVRGIQLGVSPDSPDIQRPIIASLYAFHFWQYSGVAAPTEIPESFVAPSLHLFPQTEKTPLYYWLSARVIGWTDDLILQLYSARWLAVLLSMATIPLVYATAREVLPRQRQALALVAAALAAFLPMYQYIGAAVNPDNLGAPLAAAAILLTVRALRGKQALPSAIGALLLAALAFWARRSTIVILPWALLAALACIVGWFGRRWSRRVAAALVAAGVVVVAAAALWPGDAPAAWLAHGAPWGAVRSDTAAFEGAYSLRIARGADTGPAQLVQPLPAPRVRALQGRAVLLDAMVRSAGPRAHGSLVLATPGDSERAAFAATDKWQRVSISYVVPTATLTLNVVLSADGPGELFFDRVQLLDAGGSAPAALVSDGGGEEALRWWQQRFAQNQVVQYLSRILQSARDGVYASPEAQALYPWFLYNFFSSLYGRFGWMNFGLNDWLYLAIGFGCAALLGGLALAWRRASGLEASRRRALAWLALLAFLAVATPILDYTPYLYFGTYPQGRYLFPVLAPFAALLVSGLAQILPARYERGGILATLALLIALDLWSWAGVIVPHYYR